MTDTSFCEASSPDMTTDKATAGDTPVVIPRGNRLPSSVGILGAQIRYQARLLLSNPRGVVVGVGLPTILLVASKGKAGRPDVAGYAVFGLTMTAWNTFGLRLVAARESGVLKRWRATPALTRFVPSIDAALPILMLTYFPLVIVSGVLFGIAEPHWLSTLASYLRPLRRSRLRAAPVAYPS